LARTYRSMGQFADAQREFRQVLADAPVEDADSMRRDVHRDLGLIAFQLDDSATARQEFQQVLASIPDGAQDPLGREVHRDLGRIAYRSGEYEVAAEHFSQILASAEADYEARYYLGLVYFRLGELNKAKAEFQRIVDSSDPALDESLCIDANQNLGLIAMGSSDPQSAKTYFQAALEIDPDNAPARYNLGLIYWNLGDKAAAEKEFARIVDTGSAGGKLVEQAKRNLAELKKPDKPKTVQDDPISEKPENRTLEAK
jgi:tetratricopeptide (TPR) repeat protein